MEKASQGKETQAGKVFLIGAGPGDPKLITVKGLEALKRADVVVYDRLASPRLLQYARPEAEKIFVGKLPDKHMMKQEDINRLLVDLGLQGKLVARLKGGDPSVFGRVGEEAELLAECGVPFEIVPGITSSIAVPAYAGIPVTHRDFTSSFSIVTGHEYPNKTYNKINWPNLAQASGTLIFLMGVANLENICHELITGGKSPQTPVALIRWGTWMEQETLTGTLETIVEQVKKAEFRSPAVIIVGEVVRLREKIAWFEKRPMFGRRVLVTRSRSQSSDLTDAIERLGGEAVELPVIRIQPTSEPAASAAFNEALDRLPEYDWIVFTSANGVEHMLQRMRERKLDIRRMARAKIAAVGPKTEDTLAKYGLITEVLPSQGEFRAEQLPEALADFVKPGETVFLPRGNLADTELPKRLREMGLKTVEAVAYENVPETCGGEEGLEMLLEGGVDTVTFTSSSTVVNLIELLKRQGIEEPAVLLNRLNIACIGPVTAKAAEDAGLRITAVSERATISSLVDTLLLPEMTVRLPRKGEK
ncbi:uroporphyrinogen-III C-methyltransferase [Paenibacillus turpanensis]|uniref:uroporphyrinogen-III C-methyltransferase n=1 Tax=Paenibacillus turpanensis TaxID=2689078 RepID=UPI00140D18D0|nr:uroporphyrinogen-III C-methyltransferase [Paenibacillus turpanensis]